MNRSIFQIKFLNIIYLFVFNCLMCVFILLNNNYCYCVSFRGVSEPLLQDGQYKNILFKYSKNLNIIDVKNSIDECLNTQIYNFNIVKYYQIRDNICIPFYKNTCYGHPNFFFGNYNSLNFNLQFSHIMHNNFFERFSQYDLIGKKKSQYLSNQLYIYCNDFYPQYLNNNSLNLNTHIVYENNYSLEIQNYIYNYNKMLSNIINKSLNISN